MNAIPLLMKRRATRSMRPLARTLAKVMIDTTAPHAARVSAASSLLRFSREAIELDDLAVRLEDIEQRLGVGP